MIKPALILAASFLGAVYLSGFYSAGGIHPRASTTSTVAPVPAGASNCPVGAGRQGSWSAPRSDQAGKAGKVGIKGSSGADKSVHPFNGNPAKRWPWEDMPYVIRQPNEGC